MRGFFCCLATAVWITQSCAGNGCPVSEAKEAEELSLYAQAAVLMDADSGRVLYEKNGYSPLAMASTTKIMTCILILENCDLDEKAAVSAYAASMPKVKLSVQRGEEYEIRSLLFSLMLESHNDTAVVLAEHLGSRYLPEELREKSVAEYTVEESKLAVKAFANLMNEKARELECRDTWFITPNGLDATETVETDTGEILQKEHCTTAADLARIMTYCVKESPGRDLFREITATPSYSFYENGRNVTCVNHNAFLHMMEGAFSGKTGYTNKAGYCYVGALEDDGRTFIVTLLGCGWPNNKTYKWSDTRELMEYGMENFVKREIGGTDAAFDEATLQPIPVENAQTDTLTRKVSIPVEILERHDEEAGQDTGTRELLMREDEKVEVDYDVKRVLEAPVEPGTRVGGVRYSVDGKTYLTETIVTGKGVKAVDLKWCVEQVLRRFWI